MADTITLTLGDFTFQDMEVPEFIPFHGNQVLSVKKMVGGVRQIDAMGIDPKPITWSGVIFPDANSSALNRANDLAQMRDAGYPVQLMWDQLHYLVYISDFSPDYRFGRINYSITVEILKDLSAPYLQNQQPSVDDLVGNDLLAALEQSYAVNDPTLNTNMTDLSNSIYSASSVIASANSATLPASSGTSLVGAPASVVATILQPLLAASSRASVLSAAADVTLNAAPGPGGVVSGGTQAENVASFEAILAANNHQVPLLQLGAILGRMEANMNQINNGTRTIIVSGGNLYDVAAREYGDPTAANLIMQANGLSDVTITGNVTLIIPPYSAAAVNGGIQLS